jgi:hypothetical protein
MTDYSGRLTQATVSQNMDAIHSMVLDGEDSPLNSYQRP